MASQPSSKPDVASTFADAPLPSHGAKWDSLWAASCTPWDRGAPSTALDDLLTERPELFASAEKSGGEEGPTRRRKTALVPGCGRGYDALLLRAFGYDVYGLDCSATATREAGELQRRVDEGGEGGEPYRQRGDASSSQAGTITWLTGDFFDEAFWEAVGRKPFDLIFDYTFLCALPPEARPRWAARMSELLARDAGRLVCLEWPLHKPPTSGGPPWGLTPEVYEAHLARPGEDLPYGPDGRPVLARPARDEGGRAAGARGLRRLARVKPRRTHRVGYDDEGRVVDFISVWAH